MQNRINVVRQSFGDKAGQLLFKRKEVFAHIFSALGGYIFAGALLFGEISPFGIAFCAATPKKYSISAVLGAVIGYTFSLIPDGNMKYIVSVLMVLVARWLFEFHTPIKAKLAVSTVIAGFSVAVASTAVLMLVKASVYDLALSISEVFIVCGSTYFFGKAINAIENGWHSAGKSDISCIIIAVAVSMMGLTTIEIAGVSVGRVLAIVVVLLCARYAREAGGAVAGIAMGMALGLAGGDYAYVMTAFCLGGLVAGIFGGMGSVATAASYIFINTIASLFTREYKDVYTGIIEAFVASVVFVAIPNHWAIKIENFRHIDRKSDNSTQKVLCDRLADLSDVLSEICATTQNVSAKLGKMEQINYADIYTRVSDSVCLHCGMRTTCWQFRYSASIDAMNKCIACLKQEGTITRQRVPKNFADSCCKLDDFIAALNSHFHDYIAKEHVQRKVTKVRSVVTDQFSGISMMLEQISNDLGQMKLVDQKTTKQIHDYFEKESITAENIICYTDEFDRMIIEIHIPNYQVVKLQKSKSSLDLCALLEADFGVPTIITRKKFAVVSYTEQACYTLETGAYQIAAGSGRLCGDAYDVTYSKDGKSHFILSDGMGSGGAAAVDSTMASGLITSLISVGIGYEAALKMVNSALLIKSGEESLATIDICSFDLFTGKVEFYKAGAAPTFVVKGGKSGFVESTSLPAGILRGVAFEKSSITLHENDLILMVSDGVIATGSDWVKSELEHGTILNMQKLSEKIAHTAKLRRTDGHEDDITVMAMKICRGT